MEVRHAIEASPSSSARSLPRLPPHAGFWAVAFTFLAVSAFSTVPSCMTRYRPARIYHDDSTWPHLQLGPRDDRRYFEQLIKAIFQAGLTWPIIESHWPAFGEVFYDFDPVEVAAMTEEDISRAARDPRIIRNHRKVEAAVASAAAVNEVVSQHGSFDAYLRSFDSPQVEIADLQHRFAGLGDYSAWWFMQSVGLPVPPTD